jgi:glycosyltransferase involved in cell wall biosynthesis
MKRVSGSLSMIVLAYNDAPSLLVLVPRLRNVLASLTDRFEVLIVDDGSTDTTARVAEHLAGQFPDVRLVRHPANRGVGAAFRSGWQSSRNEWIGYIDGDNQYDAEDLVLLVHEVSRGAEMVSGYRARRADTVFRRVSSALYNGFVRTIYGTSLSDTNSGIKLYRRELLEAISPLVSDRAFFDAEILIKSVRTGRRVVEVPVTHQPRRHGRALGVNRSNIRDALNGLTSPLWGDYVRPCASARLARGVAALLLKALPSTE